MLELHVTFNFESKEKRDQFLEEIKANKVEEQSREESGNRFFAFTAPLSSDCSAFLVEIWEDEAALDYHKTMPCFAAFLDSKGRLVKDSSAKRFDVTAL